MISFQWCDGYNDIVLGNANQEENQLLDNFADGTFSANIAASLPGDHSTSNLFIALEDHVDDDDHIGIVLGNSNDENEGGRLCSPRV